MKKFLGSYYWNEKVVEDVLANDFKYKDTYEKKGVKIIATEPLCNCGNYGRKVHFTYKGKEYEYNHLTGYPCQCK